MNKTFSECRDLTAAIRAKTGNLVGIAVEQGKFAVTSTALTGRKSVTTQLTGWQSHAECVVHMRQLAA